MKSFLSRYSLFVIAVIIASAVRFWQLGNIPPSLDWDEAALGYNAYSILKTGRDEYGTKFPLTIRSFDDYKPPLYVYLTIPSVALFGLEPWAVRLPSVVMGIVAVIGVYFLTEEFIKKSDFSRNKGRLLAGLSSLLLAISPWHIQFSRIAFEANAGVTINILAVYSFLRGLSSGRWLAVSSFLFGLGLYAYHSERIFLPLLVVLLVIIFRKELLKDKRSVSFACVVGVVSVLPLIPVFFNQTTLTRLRGTSALADQTGLLANSVKKLDYDATHGIWWGTAFDNRRLVWARTLLDGYLSHYSFRWLFLTGDNARHHAPDMGLLYLFELPFLLYGMFTVAQKGGKAGKLMWGWFFIAPVAAAPTTELPHAIRTLVFLPTFQIFTAIGIVQCIIWIKRKQKLLQFLFILPICIFITFNFIYYLHMYFGHTNSEYSEFWQYGYKEAARYADSHRVQYKKIVVSTKLEQSYMFFLFYLRYDPALYLQEGGTKSGGFAEYRNTFGIYEFRPIDWEKETHDGSILYVGSPLEIEGNVLNTIYFLNGKEAMRIAN